MTRRRKQLTTVNVGKKKVLRKLGRQSGPVSKSDARDAILYEANQVIGLNPHTPYRTLTSHNINQAVRITRHAGRIDAETYRIAGFAGAARETAKKEKA